VSDDIPANDRATVLYVGGESRSGSTVLSTILGAYQDMVSVGELRTVWRVLKTNQLCGCGEPISRCEFWTAVGNSAYGGWASLDVDAMLEADAALIRHRSVLRRVLFGGTPHASSILKEHQRLLGLLYGAIRAVSGSRIIVDSTKDPSYAHVLSGVPGIDLRVVNLVRDSRGVAYSNTKARIARPELENNSTITDPPFMPIWPSWQTAVSWGVKNVLLYLLIRAPERKLVKYENIVACPSFELEAIRDFAGAKRRRDGSWDEKTHTFELIPHHTLGGNPVRFRRGRVRLEADDEWKSKMSRGQKALVTAITFPLLLAFRYPVLVDRNVLASRIPAPNRMCVPRGRVKSRKDS
jgi:hypothetical protein